MLLFTKCLLTLQSSYNDEPSPVWGAGYGVDGQKFTTKQEFCFKRCKGEIDAEASFTLEAPAK